MVRDAKRLMLEIELTVPRLNKAHKYTLGQSLREKALEIAAQSVIAARDKARRQECLTTIDRLVEDMKLYLELGRKLNAYSSGRHDELFLITAGVGRQCGAWLKQHLMGQNPAPRSHVAPERAPILSAGAASSGANV